MTSNDIIGLICVSFAAAYTFWHIYRGHKSDQRKIASLQYRLDQAWVENMRLIRRCADLEIELRNRPTLNELQAHRVGKHCIYPN